MDTCIHIERDWKRERERMKIRTYHDQRQLSAQAKNSTSLRYYPPKLLFGNTDSLKSTLFVLKFYDFQARSNISFYK